MAEFDPVGNRGFNVNTPAPPPAPVDVSGVASNFWGEDGFSFGDILDLINPLQHIPIIGSIYRAVTGDQISTGSSILGGGLFGGIIGAGVAVVNAVIEEVTGGDLTDNVMALFGAEETPPVDDAPVELASADSRNEYETYNYGQAREIMMSAAAPSSAPVNTVLASAASRDQYENYNYGQAREIMMRTTPTPGPVIMAETTPQPAVAALSPTPAQAAAPTVARPATAAPQGQAWLSAVPRAEADFTASAGRYMTPEAWLQLVNNVTASPDQALGPDNLARDAVNRYSQQALAVNALTTPPAIIDSLY